MYINYPLFNFKFLSLTTFRYFWYCFCCFFLGQDLILQPRLTSKTWLSTCLSLPSTDITGMSLHAQSTFSFTSVISSFTANSSPHTQNTGFQTQQLKSLTTFTLLFKRISTSITFTVQPHQVFKIKCINNAEVQTSFSRSIRI